MSTPLTPATPPPKDVVYPGSDGQPIGATGFHVTAIFHLFQVLQEFLAGREDAYVAAGLFLYYEEGNPRARQAPSVMVTFGVDNHLRRTFKTWVEHAVPAVIFELSSDGTVEEDLHAKRELYQRLGVAEYFLFDPLGECLIPRLQGFRLEEGRYEALTPEADGSLISVRLGVRLVPEGDILRPIDLRTDQPLLSPAETAERLRLKFEQMQIAHEKRERRAQDREHRAQDRERQSEEREHPRVEELAAEVARLRALLGQQDPID